MRSAAPPPAWRWMPCDTPTAVGLLRATRRPSRTISSSVTPVSRAVRTGSNASTRCRNSAHPTVRAARYSRSSAPSWSTTCSRPRASAASEPGRGAMCSSAWAAERLRTGSMTTTCAPFLRARWITFHRWWRLVRGLLPHSRISRECSRLSGSIPVLTPRVYRRPTRPAMEQIVMSCREAPRTFHNRLPARPWSPWRKPRVPVPWYGQIASPPWRSIVCFSRCAISSRALSQSMRSNRPSPLRPTRRRGWSSRSGARVCSRNWLTFTHRVPRV